MSSHREIFFDCRLSREHLCASLRGNGVQEPGTSSIRNRKGEEAFGPTYYLACLAEEEGAK
jgi:hypothetical protein